LETRLESESFEPLISFLAFLVSKSYGLKTISRLDLFTCILMLFFSNIFDKIGTLTFSISAITVLVFNLGMLLGKVKPRESPEKVWKKSKNFWFKIV